MKATLIATALVLAPGQWDYIGDGPRPATLRDCKDGANFTISYNNLSGGEWQRFCYRRGAKTFSAHERKGKI